MKRSSMINFFTRLAVVMLAAYVTVACSDETDLGEYKLLEESKNAIPYSGNMLLTFTDSLGNQTVFEYDETQNGTGMGYQEGKTPEGEDFSAKVENYGCYLGEKEMNLGIDFRISLAVNVDFLSTWEITDLLHVDLNYNKEDYHQAHFLEQVIAPREATTTYLEQFPEEISEITLLDQTFTNVYTDNYSTLYYNYEQGVVAFKDFSGKLWVLTNTESF